MHSCCKDKGISGLCFCSVDKPSSKCDLHKLEAYVKRVASSQANREEATIVQSVVGVSRRMHILLRLRIQVSCIWTLNLVGQWGAEFNSVLILVRQRLGFREAAVNLSRQIWLLK